ncbi:MBL fold metallo-hydrolase [Pectinatus sottacetonis]|uniref:MBL fold metallo-hydrolase n=1 Tax=Pectinatus sottacetonis TaxID=1002795 RepID=UPI0018C82E17|nr:MBL fold metallo-hydrolase [Pectinatus sottacetonis]
MREVIMLGTGNAMVTKYYNTCFAVRLNEKEFFLVDAGGGNTILKQLETVGLKYNMLHHMFVTHGHTDHILGVIWIIRKIASLAEQDKYAGILNIYGSVEVINIIRTIAELTLKDKDLAQIGKSIMLMPVKDREVKMIFAAEVTFFNIFSTKKAQFGFRLIFPDGYKLSCLGDEPYNTKCCDIVNNSDLLLLEAYCLYSDRDKFNPYGKHHSTVKEACETAQKLNAVHVLLYHTEDKTYPQRKERYTAEAKQYFSGIVYVPDDLERIIL